MRIKHGGIEDGSIGDGSIGDGSIKDGSRESGVKSRWSLVVRCFRFSEVLSAKCEVRSCH